MGHHSLGFWLAISILLGSAYADPLDDFTNNLISDLAPLLALFGERVTMQFLGQSLGLADCVALAMAPLGIITILVSAIRVGGPMWLKAIIGRAAENRAAVELDLMSSTSQEVCELYNGQSIVKCQGKGRVWEYICLIPKKRNSSPPNISEPIEFSSLEKARKRDITNDRVWTLKLGLKESRESSNDTLRGISTATEWNIRRPWSRRQKSNASPPISHENALEQGLISPNPSAMTVIRNTDPEAPNISLNMGNKHDRTAITIVAVIGTVLQIGVLAFFGMITYYPKIQPDFTKDGNSAPRHAFPLTASGTILLVTGLLLCSHVVENSTTENWYKAPVGYEMRTYWIQQGGTVGDQVFESFAIYSSGTQTVLLTSRRPDYSIEEKKELWVQWKTAIGVLLGLVGFVLQFVGLRAMSSAASLTQLGAVVFMAIIRALVRTEFSNSLCKVSLKAGHELDWLARELLARDTFTDIQQTPKPHSKSSSPITRFHKPTQKNQTTSSHLTTEPAMFVYENMPCPEARSWEIDVSKDSPFEVINEIENNVLPASQLLVGRRQLGKLANYRAETSKVAVKLTMALEECLNAFFGTNAIYGAPGTFRWNPKVEHNFSVDKIKAEEVRRQVEVNLKLCFDYSRESWKVLADDVDAALSLWVATAQEIGNGNSKSKDHSFGYTSKDDDQWLRGQVYDDHIRVLGPTSTFGDLCFFGPDHNFNEDGAPTFFIVSEYVKQIDESNTSGSMASESDTGETDAGETDTGETDTGETDTGETDTGETDTGETDAGETSTDESDTDESDDGIERHNFVGWSLTEVIGDRSPKLHAHRGFIWDDSLSPIAVGVHTEDSIEMRFAKDLLFAFMRSMTKHIQGPLECEVQCWPPTTKEVDLKLMKYGKLYMSDLTKRLVDLGFGSSHEAASLILVPLSMAGKLPSYEIFGKICSHVIAGRKDSSWESSDLSFWAPTFDVLKNLYREHQSIGFGWLLTLLVDSIHDINFIIELQQMEGLERSAASHAALYFMANRLRYHVNFNNGKLFLSHLAQVYSKQRRDLRLLSKLEEFCALPSNINVGPTELEELLQSKGGALQQPRATPDPWDTFADFFKLSKAHLKAMENEELNTEEASEWAGVRDILGATPLHYAASVRGSTAVLILLGAGADVHAKDLHAYTPLHYGFGYGDWENVKSLCEYAKPKFPSSDGYALWSKPGTDGALPVHVAAAQNNTAVIEGCLNNSGLTTHMMWLRYDFQGRTALHWAVIAGHIEVVELLWRYPFAEDAKPVIDPPDKYGWKSIHLAVLHDKVDIVRRLCELSADLGEQDNEGRTPLALASKNGRLEAARVLLDPKWIFVCGYNAYVFINTPDNDGNTPLHLCHLHGHSELEKELLDAGAVWNIKNRKGQAPHLMTGEEDSVE